MLSEQTPDIKQGNFSQKYLLKLKGKSLFTKSKVYSNHQMVGLEIAKILDDEKNKGLYMKLCAEKDLSYLMGLAKDISDRPGIRNKGAYFTKLIYRK